MISKKKVFLSYFVFAMSLFSNFVSAAPAGLEGVFNTIRRLFGFLPDLITLDKLIGQDAAAVFWAKFLIWVLLFAILYFGATAIPRLANNKRIATTIALTISLISVFLIPNAIITSIFQTYGLVAGILLWFIPLSAMLYLNYKIQVRWLRVFILLLALIILMNIDATVHTILPNPDWADYFSLLLVVVLLMFLWNLFAAIFGEGWAEGPRGWAGGAIRHVWDDITRPRESGRPAEVHGGGDNPLGGFWNWLTRPRDPGRRGPGGEPGPGGGPRPPGPLPPPTPPRRHPTDPPTPTVPPSGEDPKAPVIPAVKEPKKPKIPDEKEIFIDLSPHFNGIRSQDGVGACTAFASTSIFEYIFNVLRVGNHAKKYLSPLFLYYHSRKRHGAQNSDSGTSSSNAIDTLHKEGVCFEDLWKFENPTIKFRIPPDRNAEMDAVLKKIKVYRALDSQDPDQWVYELLNYNPCYISIKVPNDFNGHIYTNNSPVLTGGHGMVIVGYHSHYPYGGRGIKAFKLRNSWDVTWGENGYIWIPAEILVKIVNTGVWVFKGWKKDNYPLLNKLGSNTPPKENQGILEKIKKFAEEEKEWLAAEYNFLNLLKGHVYEGRYKEANGVMRQVGRSEKKSFYFEQRLDENLSELIRELQEPYKSAIARIKERLVVLSKSLLILTSRHEGGIRQKIEDLLERGSKMEPKEYQKHAEELKKMVDKAIEYLRGIETELDRLIGIEDVLGFEKNAYRSRDIIEGEYREISNRALPSGHLMLGPGVKTRNK